MENKAFNQVFNDILSKVFQLSEDPSQFADYLTQQIRELIGARTIVIAVKAEFEPTRIFSVFPTRRTEWANQNEVLQLAELSGDFEKIQYLGHETSGEAIALLLKTLEIDKAIVIPLIAANRKVGSILLLDILDAFGIESVIDLLTRLSGVFALVIRNSILYQNMENLVAIRTNELRKKNNDLEEAVLQAEESKNHTKEILQTAMDGFLMVDLKGKFMDVNEVACKMVGYTRAEMLKLSIFDLEIVETAEQTQKHIQKIFEIGEDRFETKHRCKNGEIIDVELSVKFQSDQNLFVVFVRDITNSKLDEEALKRSTQLLSETEKIGKVGGWEINIDTMDATWTGGVYTIQEVELNSNQNVEKGINFYAPESRPVISKAVQRAIEFGEPFDLELEIITAKGNRRNVHAIGKADLKHRRVYGFFQDITERKLSEAALRKSEARFRAWFELPIIGICITSPTKGWLEVNDHLYNMLGYGRDELFKLNWADLTHPEDLAADNAQFLRVIDGQIEGYSLEKRFLRKDGSTFHSELAVRCVRGVEGHVDYFVALIQDITERKQAEQKVMESQAELKKALEGSNQSRQTLLSVLEDKRLADREIQKLNAELEQRVIQRTAQLEEVNRELESFSYSVSHDLRAPLRHISGFADMLANDTHDQLSEKAQHYLHTINDSARKMGILIDDLLSFSRTGRTEMRKTSIGMNQVVKDAIKQVEISTKDRNIEWEIANLPAAYGDYNLLLLVWINLVDNAVKYTRKREKAIIQIDCHKEKDEYIFRICDNGAGFDMKYAQKLFGVFQRLHSSTEFEGTGIGLANVRRIILRHGGRTWAEAEPDKGATFYFTLPC